jgi:hypothetical protein
MWNCPEIGITEEIEFSTNCRFKPDGAFLPVVVNWPGCNLDGKTGLWVGSDTPILSSMDGHELTPEYAIIVWDKNKKIGEIHIDRINLI